MRLALLVAAFACLASCGAVVPSTIAALYQLDPLTADPEGIEIVLILPPGLAVAPGSASLSLTASRDDQEIAEAFVLEPAPVSLQGITVPQGATGQLFRLAPANVARMRDVQARVSVWEAEDPAGTKGGFSVFVGGCGVGEGPAHDATASILIRTAKDGPFLPLVRDASLRAVLGPDLFDAITPCTTAQ